MDYLNWELTLLSRAIAYKNLSGAAQNIGISQPQLSRVIAKLEREFGVTLLDRDSKRKSVWLPSAFKLADIYSRMTGQFFSEIKGLTSFSEPSHLKIGSLEGLGMLALKLCKHLYAKTSVKIIEMNIYDLSDLEENFFKGSLDFVLTSREPGRKKFKHELILGYQALEPVKHDKSMRVMSSFEYATEMHSPKFQKEIKGFPIFVSNSLFMKEKWLENHGGFGSIPSSIHKTKRAEKKELPVLLIGTDELSGALWGKIEKFSA